MPLDLATLLSDSTKYPDTLEIPVGDEKVQLGILRSTVRDAQKAASDQKAAYEHELEKAKDISTQAAELMAKLNSTTTATTKVEQPTTEDFFETDPYFKPVRERLTPLEKQLKEVMEATKKQEAAMQQASLIFARRMWREDYRDVKDQLKGDKYKDYRSPDKLAEYALKNQLLDEFGLPSVTKAAEHLTREDEIDRIRKEAREEGLKEGRVQARMQSMPRPTSAAGARGGAKDKGLDPSKNFEDLGDAVAEDAELMGMISQIGNIDPSQLQ